MRGTIATRLWDLPSALLPLKNFFPNYMQILISEHDPHSAGRNMNSHFASRLVGEDGEFLDLVNMKNFTAGLAPTAAHIPRSLGLAYASKAFREIKELGDLKNLSVNGNEICFCTIGDASTSEGHFWEIMNAAGVSADTAGNFCLGRWIWHFCSCEISNHQGFHFRSVKRISEKRWYQRD